MIHIDFTALDRQASDLDAQSVSLRVAAASLAGKAEGMRAAMADLAAQIAAQQAAPQSDPPPPPDDDLPIADAPPA
jgi:hypothetical protein